jgi:hypothetical protein
MHFAFSIFNEVQRKYKRSKNAVQTKYKRSTNAVQTQYKRSTNVVQTSTNELLLNSPFLECF